MSLLRVPFRALAFLGATLAGYLALLAVAPLRHRAPERRLRLRNAVYRWWGRSLCRSAGLRLRVEGEPPDGAFLLVCNHQSYMDVPILGSRLRTTFVAKADLRRWPLVGRAFAAGDTLFIDRARKRDLMRVLEEIEGTLEAGLGVVLFAEGTSSDGRGLLPFRPSLLELAARQRRGVHYAVLSYRTPPGEPPASEAVCWWGDAPFLPHLLRFLRLPWLEATLSFGGEEVVAADRKLLAEELRAAMLEHFTPSR